MTRGGLARSPWPLTFQVYKFPALVPGVPPIPMPWCFVPWRTTKNGTAEELAEALSPAGSRWKWLSAGTMVVAVALAGVYPPVWPDVPAVLEAQERLAGGEMIELIGPGKHQAAFGWESGRVISQPDEEFRLVNLSPSGCLVEVEVKNGTNTLGSDTADNSVTWVISFPSANNNAVVVKGGGKNIPVSTLNVDTATGVVTSQVDVVHHTGQQHASGH